MSNRRRAHPRLHRSRYDVCTHIAWAVDLDGIEVAKKAAHDALIVGMGDRRRSGVRWVVRTGADALTVLDRLDGGEDGIERNAVDFVKQFVARTPGAVTAEEGTAGYDDVRGLLRERGGYLVVAMADGVR